MRQSTRGRAGDPGRPQRSGERSCSQEARSRASGRRGPAHSPSNRFFSPGSAASRRAPPPADLRPGASQFFRPDSTAATCDHRARRQKNRGAGSTRSPITSTSTGWPSRMRPAGGARAGHVQNDSTSNHEGPRPIVHPPCGQARRPAREHRVRMPPRRASLMVTPGVFNPGGIARITREHDRGCLCSRPRARRAASTSPPPYQILNHRDVFARVPAAIAPPWHRIARTMGRLERKVRRREIGRERRAAGSLPGLYRG